MTSNNNTTNTYYRYGTSLDVMAVHTQALVDWASIVEETVGVTLPGIPVFEYDPETMTDDEVTELLKKYCLALGSHGGDACLSPQDVRDGSVCGGVCGPDPVLVYKVGSCCGDTEEANVQNVAVHELTHVVQRTLEAPSHSLGDGDAQEDWRGNGPRWWTEGTAVWLGSHAGEAYPDDFASVDPLRQNFGRTLAEACESFRTLEASRNIDLTVAIQASDDKWDALWVVDEALYPYPYNAYYPTVYEGGYCAVEFLLRENDYETTQDKVAGLLRVMKQTQRLDSWERAFLTEFANFRTLADFYTAFEGKPVSEHDACPPGPLDATANAGTCVRLEEEVPPTTTPQELFPTLMPSTHPSEFHPTLLPSTNPSELPSSSWSAGPPLLHAAAIHVVTILCIMRLLMHG